MLDVETPGLRVEAAPRFVGAVTEPPAGDNGVDPYHNIETELPR